MLENLPRAVPSVADRSYSRTLDKMMHNRKPLVSAKVDKPIAAVKGTRNSTRDRCLLLLMFRHGLRVLEACRFQLSQVDIESRVLSVTRLIQDYLGHRNIQHTVRYTATNPARFEKTWR
jgi:site-specific recombinase XerD